MLASTQPYNKEIPGDPVKFVATKKTIFYKLGDRTMPIRVLQYGDVKNIICINLHDNENTSVEAARSVLELKGGTLIKIENNDQRVVRFKWRGIYYSFDPNRIFSRVGIEQTLKENKRTSQLAIEEIEKFCSRSPVFIAGSTWPEDEKLIKDATANFPDLKVIIAPHEIHKEHIDQLKTIFPNAVLHSQLKARSSQSIISNRLIIDNIGMLSKLYHYATIAYVGGGFNKGIHNTLEAAVYGKPVLFGPNYKKFKEAIGLIETGGGICISSSNELSVILQKFISHKSELELSSKNSFDFVKQNKGATEKILHYIEANRLLTN